MLFCVDITDLFNIAYRRMSIMTTLFLINNVINYNSRLLEDIGLQVDGAKHEQPNGL